MPETRFLSKYKNTVSDLNTWHSFLLRRMTVGDCRAEYLWTFEVVLDANCPFSLKENPRYIRLTARYPLPERGYVSRKHFWAFMELYNYIMRDAGLLTRETESDEQFGERMDAFGGS